MVNKDNMDLEEFFCQYDTKLYDWFKEMVKVDPKMALALISSFYFNAIKMLIKPDQRIFIIEKIYEEAKDTLKD